jgi:hypothetical protein
MLVLMGHMSRAMLERYSHIRRTVKPDAVAGVSGQLLPAHTAMHALHTLTALRQITGDFGTVAPGQSFVAGDIFAARPCGPRPGGMGTTAAAARTPSARGRKRSVGGANS